MSEILSEQLCYLTENNICITPPFDHKSKLKVANRELSQIQTSGLSAGVILL